MMHLENEQALVDDLERGIGEMHWSAFAYPASVRLRLALCAETNLALDEAYRDIGVVAEPIESWPHFAVEPTSKHVFEVVTTEQGKFIVDPTYSQFLDMTGLSPEYVLFGGEDLYPKKKIAVFPYNDGEQIAQEMVDAVVAFREQRKDIYGYEGAYRMEDFTPDQLFAEYSKIWDPNNFEAYVPKEPETIAMAHRFAQFIVPEHVKLVA
jgi:hypothetical protein